MPELTFPTLIDNTQREAFFSCPTKWMYSFARRLAPATSSVHLHAGAAFARGLEVARKRFYGEGLASEEAIYHGTRALIETYGDFVPPESGSGSVKTCERMVEALEAYFDRWPLQSDTLRPAALNYGPAVEFTFTLPIPGVFHPDTGDPLLYAGRFDMLGERDGMLWVCDEKTTSALGTSWASQWDLNSQFTGYCWAARQFGYPVVGAVVRGIGLLKTETKFIEVPIFRPEFQLNRWLEQLIRDVRRMIVQYREWQETGRDFDMALGHACSNYGGCPFRTLCISNEPERWIEGRFVERTWDPLAKGDGE